MKAKKTIGALFAATCFVVLLTSLRSYRNTFEQSEDISLPQPLLPAESEQCNILTDMTSGHWKTRPLTAEENKHMYRFLKRVRHDFKFPPNYQRSDGLCGNISTKEPGVKGPQGGYRAVCDPEGATPCCFDYKCAYKSIEECKCENCFDIRNMKHAEYSSWIPSNPSCVYHTHTPQRACQILKGLNIAFVGDSLIRNFYTALLLVVTGNMKDGAMKTNVTEDIKEHCSNWHMFLGKSCRFYVDDNVSLCDGTVNVTGYFYYRSTFLNILKDKIRLQKTSFIVAGSGIHNNYDETVVQQTFLEPFIKTIRTLRTMPRFLWAAPHSPGILKSPTYIHQSYAEVKRFNAKMKSYLTSREIPVFDTFNMTDGMMSIDGQHYGIGMNLVKANILLDYIANARKQQDW